jgi:hypothetical protein
LASPTGVPSSDRDQRLGEVEVERVDHERKRLLVDLEGDEVALVRGGEELPQLGEG